MISIEFNFQTIITDYLHDYQWAKVYPNMENNKTFPVNIYIYRGVATLGSSRHVPTHNFHTILRKI